MNDVIQKASRLKELDRLIIKAVADCDIEQLSKHIVEYNGLKKHIRTYALENPIVNLQEIADSDVRFVIQKIISGDPSPTEKALSGSLIGEFLKGELDEQDIEDLGSDLFYSWFSHQEYLQGLYEIGALTLSCGSIPENLSRFVDEARSCYAFQQFNAVFSLCRTILEICIKDIATACGILPVDLHNVRHIASRLPDLYDLINQLCYQFPAFSRIQDQLHGVRRRTNSIIHGNRLVKRDEAKNTLKETLSVIHELYELEAARPGAE